MITDREISTIDRWLKAMKQWNAPKARRTPLQEKRLMELADQVTAIIDRELPK